MNGFADAYISALQSAAGELERPKIEAIVDEVLGVWRRHGTVFTAGNGGSASTSSHFVCDITKLTRVDGLAPIRAACLSDNVATHTAWSNDTSYEMAFASQIDGIVGSSDLLWAISGSGNSPNVLRLVERCRQVDCRSVGLTGFDGGRLASIVDIALVVPSTNMQVIEDVHLAICHIVAASVKGSLENFNRTGDLGVSAEDFHP